MADGRPAGALDTYLKDDERLYHLLTNTQVGVERGGSQGETIRPGDGGKAYLGLTDRRIIILVVDPVDRDSDFVTSHRYTNIADEAVRTESLTACVEFETEYGRTWSFTAREADIAAVSTFFSVACSESGESSAELAALKDHCVALSGHLARGEWDAFDDRVPAATEAAERLAHETTHTAMDDTEAALRADFHCLVRDRYVLAGREELASARPRLEAGDFELSYRRARTAYDHFERALERAKREELGTENAMIGLTMADDIADTSLGRLFATGRERSAAAAEQSSVEDRIDVLETALEIYETVASLVTGDETLSGHARDRAREEAATVIEELIDARLTAAADSRQAADWERTVGNVEAARELADEARADLDRALELAASYPPGDADEIRDRLDALDAQYGAGE